MSYSPCKSLRITADSIFALAAGVLIHKVMVKNGTTSAVASLAVHNGAALVASQTHADFDGVAPNGSFAGGVDYDVNDTITLTDGTVITVNAVDDDPINGVVTQFTVTTAGTAGFKSGAGLAQATTDGQGSGFRLVADTDNLALVTSLPVAECIVDEVTDGTAAEFARSKEINFNPPLQLDKGASLDIAGTNAIGYVYYSLVA